MRWLPSYQINEKVGSGSGSDEDVPNCSISTRSERISVQPASLISIRARISISSLNRILFSVFLVTSAPNPRQYVRYVREYGRYETRTRNRSHGGVLVACVIQFRLSRSAQKPRSQGSQPSYCSPPGALRRLIVGDVARHKNTRANGEFAHV